MKVDAVDLRLQRDLGEILGLSAQVYRRHAHALIPIALLSLPLEVVQRFSPGEHGIPFQVSLVFLTFGVSQIIAGALIFGIHEALQGRESTPYASLSATGPRAWALITTPVLAVTLSVLSLVFFPYFIVRWYLNQQAVVLEEESNWSALDLSSSLVRGYWWRVFGITLLLGAIPFGLAVADLALVVAHGNGSILEIVSLGFGPLSAPFFTSVATLLYFDLKARHSWDDKRSEQEPSTSTEAMDTA